MMYLEDYQVGQSAVIGEHLFTADEIVRFAAKFDPQPFHLSEEAAKAGPFGRLAASGWMTCAVWMKLMIAYQIRIARERLGAGLPVAMNGPSPGFTELRWSAPVYAGDTLTYVSEVIETRPSASRPGWGVLRSRNLAFNQDGAEVFSFLGVVFAPTRPKD
jgi:acyl dehydratase